MPSVGELIHAGSLPYGLALELRFRDNAGRPQRLQPPAGEGRPHDRRIVTCVAETRTRFVPVDEIAVWQRAPNLIRKDWMLRRELQSCKVPLASLFAIPLVLTCRSSKFAERSLRERRDNMAGPGVKARRGTAEPRWGWSGVARVVAPHLSIAATERLLSVLPVHQTPVRQITAELRDFGGRYHRYLHQDEFGPRRAERTAALRSLRNQFRFLSLQLAGLPRYLRLELGEQLSQSAPRQLLLAVDAGFEAYSCDEQAVQQLAEAAFMLRHTVDGLEVGLIASAEDAAQLLSALDTTTSGSIADELILRPLNVTSEDEGNFAIVHARIERLLQRIELALARLKARGGPEPAISLIWLVGCLCDLYYRETGRPVTSNAVEDYRYTGTPQSPAGRFVLACVEALQPPLSWINDPDHQAPLRRARILSKAAVQRGVYFAMREYVARHRSQGPRRGRRKRVH
jgi:hypothetical protein